MTEAKHRMPQPGDEPTVTMPPVAGASQNGGGGVGEFLKVSGSLAKAAGALTRRLTVDIGGVAAQAGKDVFDGARSGKSSSEIAATVINDWVDGARQVLGFDEELQRIGHELKEAAKPMVEYMPAPVKEVAHQIAELAPIKAVTDMTGMTVTDMRRNLRHKGRDLLRRSTLLDDPDEHPAMSVILDEISPDEARIIRYLGEAGPQAVIDVVASNPMTRKKREMVHNYSLVAREAGCIRPHYGAIYLDNLARLGVASIRDYRLRSQRNYDLLSCQPEVMDIKKPPGRLVKLKLVCKGIELSEFGKQLFKNCLETETSHLAVVPDQL